MSVETSILLPTYNGAAFLRPQLDSLLAQTYRDFELLICDDGSSDGTVDIIAEYAGRDPRIRLAHHPVNLGQGAALRHLLALARGSLIAFSDQDDVWHPEKLARLRAGIGEAALAYGSSRLIDADGRPLGSALLDHISVRLEGADNAKFLLKNSVSGHALLARRSVVDPTAFLVSRPFDWVIATVASFAGGVVFVEEACTEHRMHANNQLNRGFGTRRAKPRTHWRGNCLALRETLALLAMSEAVGSAKRRAFRELHDLVSEEVVGGGIASARSYRFPQRFMAALARLSLPSVDQAYIARRLRSLRGPGMRVLDRLRPEAMHAAQAASG